MNLLLVAELDRATGHVKSDAVADDRTILPFEIKSTLRDYIGAWIERDFLIESRDVSGFGFLRTLKSNPAIFIRIKNPRTVLVVSTVEIDGDATASSALAGKVRQGIACQQGAIDRRGCGGDAGATVSAGRCGGDGATAVDVLVRDDVAVGDIDASGDVDSSAACQRVDAAAAANILSGGGGGDSDVAERGAEDAHKEGRVDVLNLDLDRLVVAVDGLGDNGHSDVAGAILKTVELRITLGRDSSLCGAAAGAELRGTGERGAVGSGLHETTLIAQIAEIDRETGGAEENDKPHGGEGEAVAEFLFPFVIAVGVSHCDISKASDEGRRRCGECARGFRGQMANGNQALAIERD